MVRIQRFHQTELLLLLALLCGAYAKRNLTIGVVLPLTGGMNPSGQVHMLWMEATRDWINLHPDFNDTHIKLEYRDATSETRHTAAMMATVELAYSPSPVHAIIGAMFSSHTVPMAMLTETFNLVQVGGLEPASFTLARIWMSLHHPGFQTAPASAC